MSDRVASSRSDGLHRPRWIVGVDDSAGSSLALRWAVAQGGNRASILAVRAWELDLRGVGAYSYPILYERDLTATQRALAEAVAPYAETVPSIESRVVRGPATRALTDISRDTDLLILGTRMRPGIRGRIGSVSRYCASHGSCPLIVVPQETDPDRKVADIVIGMDGSPNALAALSWALEFEPAVSLAVVSAGSVAAAVEAEDLIGPFPEDRTVSFRAVEGDPVPALVAASADADLVVVGARGRSQLAATLLGSVSTAILAQSHCPVAIVPTPEQAASHRGRRSQQ